MSNYVMHTVVLQVKLDGGANPPSRVVHIRSLPHEVAETDIVQLGMPFGKMTNVLVLKQKNQVGGEIISVSRLTQVNLEIEICGADMQMESLCCTC